MSFREIALPGALLALSAGAALAVAPPAQVDPGVVSFPSAYRDRVLSEEIQQRMSSESTPLRAFNARYGEWHVAVWDELTGTPDRAFGEPIQLVNGVVDETTVVEAALRFVGENADMFGVAPTDLGLKSVRRGRDVFYVQLQQSFGGVPVYDGRVILRIDTAGRLLTFGSDVYPDVSANPFARLSDAAAITAARTGLVVDEHRDAAQHVGRVILPIPGEDHIDYVTTHDVLFQADGQTWQAYVNAETGSIVWREPTTRNLDIIGDVTGEVVPEDPFGPTFDGAMWHQNVFASPAGVSTSTAEDGSFDIPYGGVDQQTAILTFFTGNQHFNVDDNLQMDAVIQDPITPGTFQNIHWDDSNSQQQERVPFYHLQRQREKLLAFDPAFPIVVDPVEVETNFNGTCNAQWTGSKVLLFREGGGCIATGRTPSVAAHEYGHGLSSWQYGGSLPCALIEAFPDVKAMYYTEQPQIGTGFTGPGTLLRDGRNTLTWPSAVASCGTGGYAGGECHCKADVTMGAAWKTRVNFVEKYGEEMGPTLAETAIHYGIYSSPTSPQLYVNDVLFEDDDDGNLNNGTPNYDQICAAFEFHGLPCPAVTEFLTIVHTPLTDTVNDSEPYEVVATITATNETVDTSNIFVSYRVSGAGWTSVPMVATGQPDEYSADIPAQVGGEYVDYYITAAGVGGAVAEDPNDAPFAGVHRFVIGTFDVVFADDVESDQGWTLGDAGDTATSGVWVRDDPNGTTQASEAANPEDDATPNPGTDCFFTGQGPVGGGAFEADIDGGCTTLTSPVFDLSSTTFARLKYQRWFHNNGADSDALTVEISTDGGGSWQELEAVTGLANSWTESSHDITASEYTMSANTMVRFVACDDLPAAIVEAAVDEISLAFLTTDVTDVADAAPLGRFRVEQNRPNPFNPVTHIRYEVASNDHVSVRIYNVTGQLVRTLVDRQVDAGVYNVTWDGTTETGDRVASGTYFYRVLAGENESVRAMTLLK